METLTDQNQTPVILHRALAWSRRAVNARLLERRIAQGMCAGLVLCFPILVLMLLWNMPLSAMLAALTGVNILCILISLVRSSWANTIDAAIYLEQKHRQDGLFITAAEYISRPQRGRGNSAQRMHILAQAAGLCAAGKIKQARAIKFTLTSPRQWAVNGLLVLGLLITVVVGRSMVALPSNAADLISSSGGAAVNQAQSAGPAGTAPSPQDLKKYHAPNAPRKVSTSSTPRGLAENHTPAPLPPQAMRALINLQSQMNSLMSTAVPPSKASGAGHGTTAGSTGTSSAGAQLADLKSQLLSAADVPGMGAKIKMALVAAAHAIHASSHGDFAPMLRKVNRRIKAFLAFHGLPHTVASRGLPSTSMAMGAAGTLLNRSPVNTNSTLETAPDRGRAIVMDLPHSVESHNPVDISWIRHNSKHAADIPARYRNIINRYFSAGHRAAALLQPSK
jgi:hypothetical protein